MWNNGKSRSKTARTETIESNTSAAGCLPLSTTKVHCHLFCPIQESWEDKVDKESRGHMRIRDKEIKRGGNTPRQKNDRNNETPTWKQGGITLSRIINRQRLWSLLCVFGESCSLCVCSAYQFGQDCLCLSRRKLILDNIYNLICSEGQSQNCWPILQPWRHVAQSWKKCPIMIWSLRRHLERLQAAKPQSPRKYASAWHKGMRTRVVHSQFYKTRTLQHLCCRVLLLSNYVLLMRYSMVQKVSKEGVPEYLVWELLSGPSMLYNIAGPDTTYLLLRILDRWVSSSYNWPWILQCFTLIILKAPLLLRRFVPKHLTNPWHMEQNSTRSASHNEALPQTNQTQNMWSSNK